MSKLVRLIKGELNRLVKYKILPVSLVTALIWIGVLMFISAEEARKTAPLFIFVDVAVMSVLLLGASFHLEKQDGTIKTMMVMPVSLSQILAAKTVASMVLAFESVVITSVALYLIHGVSFNYIVLLLFVAIAGAAHAAIGFSISLNSKDFTSMLGLLALYIFLFTAPSILLSFGIIDAKYEWLFMISPSHSANHLITSVISGEYRLAIAIAGCLYLTFLTAVLFKYVVYSKFKENAVRG
jgi:fluoroquinolone transport system permease protein